jgi:hypothetical protein
MSKQATSALSGLVVAIFTALVSFGVIGGDQATVVQGVVIAAVSFAATVGIHSARAPK